MSIASKSKLKKVTITQMEYQQLAKSKEPPRPVVRNCVRAFVVGGIICLIGEGLMKLFQTYFGFSEKTAGNPTVLS